MSDESANGQKQTRRVPNPEQQLAIDTIDGPVLVVAGPGTGKTELLSQRVANILEKSDVRPKNILCLTFTEAGARAMTTRLSEAIGKDAYGVHISTFHSFATDLRSRFPEFFERGAFDTTITELQARRKLNELLNGLSVTDPLYQKPRNGVANSLNEMRSFIGNMKKSGLKPDELRAITKQNLEFFEYIAKNTSLIDLISTRLSSSVKKNREFLDSLEGQLHEMAAGLPQRFKESVVKLKGCYVPYGIYLFDEFLKEPLYDEEGKTGAYKDLRDRFFGGAPKTFKDIKSCRKMMSAIAVFERYQAWLRENALYDFDDMILDAIAAIEESKELKCALQEQYQYILIDEFQDTNGAQMRLIDLLIEGKESPNILAVGDDDQAIMRFQGASVEFINDFESHLEGVRRIVLKTNYRSTQPLIDLGQKIVRQIENRSSASKDEKELIAYRELDSSRQGGTSLPTAFVAGRYPTQDVQYFDIARGIREKLDAGFVSSAKKPDEAIAVIAPKRRSLEALIPYLNRFGIDYNYKVSASVSKIESLQTTLALMRFAVFYSQGDLRRADACLPQILAAKEFGIKAKDYFSFALEAKRANRGWMDMLESHHDPALCSLHGWLQEIALHSIGAPAQQSIFEVSKPIRMYYRIRQQDEPFATIEFNYGLRALLAFVEAECGKTEGLGEEAHPKRLKDVVATLNEADRFAVDIDTTIPIGRPEAITLTTAHSAKGLEYDLVYLLDTDDATWYKSPSGLGVESENIFLNEQRDDNDIRRLLFVAITRARSYLEIGFGRQGIVRDLSEAIGTEQREPSVDEIAMLSETTWKDEYYPRDDDLKGLIYPLLERLKMSVSLLNRFVEYDESNLDGAGFFTDRLLSLPSEPNVNLDFGTIVHAFFEEYLIKVIKAGELSEEQLLETCHRQIEGLDHEASDITHLHERLDLIAEEFLPGLTDLISAGALVEQSINAMLDGIPLYGKCDVLVLDEKARTIKVYDYKTGTPPMRKAGMNSQYRRQLQFYKLLIEGSPEYEGWSVVGGADIYVEPAKELDFELAEPQFFSVPEEDLERLQRLIRAVWHRIQNGLFDVSGFKASRHLQEAIDGCVYKGDSGDHKAGDPKEPDKSVLQPAFEQWLIDTYEASGAAG